VEIVTMSFPGVIRAVRPIPIELAGTNPLNPDVPHITGAVVRGIQSNDSEGHAICWVLKQLEPNAAGVTAEEGEVDSGSIFMGSHR
jgi:hypothetical protein